MDPIKAAAKNIFAKYGSGEDTDNTNTNQKKNSLLPSTNLKHKLMMKNLGRQEQEDEEEEEVKPDDGQFGSKESVGDDQDYDDEEYDDEDYDEDYDDEKPSSLMSGIKTSFGSRPWAGGDKPGSKGGSASSFFRTYAKTNIGGSFR